MSGIYIGGLGVVSPAGWDLPAMRAALLRRTLLPTAPLDRPGRSTPLRCRPVPDPIVRPRFFAHPRLRRASAITHYAAAALLEAIAPLRAHAPQIRRVGLVICLDAACVQYSFRFFDEVLKNPATASPLLFPETVFSALASNLSGLLDQTPLACTLTGDAATFLQGLAVAADWLLDDRADIIAIIGAEEINWLLADGLWHLDRHAILAGGAGAIALVRDPQLSLGVELAAITDVHPYTALTSRSAAVEAMRDELPPGAAGELLCDSIGNSPRTDRAEIAAWRDWPGDRLSPKQVLGEGLAASAAWQCAAAVDAILEGTYSAANVSVVGANQQAIGTRFVGIVSPLSPIAA